MYVSRFESEGKNMENMAEERSYFIWTQGVQVDGLYTECIPLSGIIS